MIFQPMFKLFQALAKYFPSHKLVLSMSSCDVKKENQKLTLK